MFLLIWLWWLRWCVCRYFIDCAKNGTGHHGFTYGEQKFNLFMAVDNSKLRQRRGKKNAAHASECHASLVYIYCTARLPSCSEVRRGDAEDSALGEPLPYRAPGALARPPREGWAPSGGAGGALHASLPGRGPGGPGGAGQAAAQELCGRWCVLQSQWRAKVAAHARNHLWSVR